VERGRGAFAGQEQRRRADRLGVECVAGTSLFLRSPLVRASSTAHGSGHERVSALASPELRALLGPVALTGVALGAVEVGLPSLALHAGSRPASGLLLALWSVGSMTGGLWYGARVWRSSLSTRYQLLLLVLVVCTAPLIAAQSIAAGIVCSLLAGVATLRDESSLDVTLHASRAPSSGESMAKRLFISVVSGVSTLSNWRPLCATQYMILKRP